MYVPSTVESLVGAFANKTIVGLKGYIGIISSLEHEDGSGRRFNVVLQIWGIREDKKIGLTSKKVKLFVGF